MEYGVHYIFALWFLSSSFLPIALLTFGTLYLQQSFLVIMSLLLNAV